jgi:hypothetical protein
VKFKPQSRSGRAFAGAASDPGQQARTRIGEPRLVAPPTPRPGIVLVQSAELRQLYGRRLLARFGSISTLGAGRVEGLLRLPLADDSRPPAPRGGLEASHGRHDYNALRLPQPARHLM